MIWLFKWSRVNNNANAVGGADSAADSLIKRVRLLSPEECGMEAARRGSPDLAQSAASPVTSESVFINAESANQGRRYSMLIGESLCSVIDGTFLSMPFLLAEGELLGRAVTWVRCCVNHLPRFPLACLGSREAAEQLWTLRKHFSKPLTHVTARLSM